MPRRRTSLRTTSEVRAHLSPISRLASVGGDRSATPLRDASLYDDGHPPRSRHQARTRAGDVYRRTARSPTLSVAAAAALSLTTLFRSSKTASKRAYNAGYAAACQDLLNMIQQGVSTDADPSREVTIGRIMDYIEARLEAIKAREEEEDEEEERSSKAGPSTSKPKPPSPPLAPARTREMVRPTHTSPPYHC